MKIVIMQPYLFPYLGYFQLIRAVDAFVVYDDVNYIKGGWINRNYILANGDRQLITLPLQGASRNKLIHQIEIGERHKILKSLHQNYGKAPHFGTVYPMLEDILAQTDSRTSSRRPKRTLSASSITSCVASATISACAHNGIFLQRWPRTTDFVGRKKCFPSAKNWARRTTLTGSTPPPRTVSLSVVSDPLVFQPADAFSGCGIAQYNQRHHFAPRPALNSAGGEPGHA